MIRTQEQLQEWFQREKEKRLRQRQLLKEKNRKEKAEKRKRIKLLLKKQETKQEEEVQTISRTIIIYHTKYIERFSGDEDLYNTRKELQDAEERGEGRINWEVWDRLIKETRQQISACCKR